MSRQRLYRAVKREYADVPLESRSQTGRFHTKKETTTYLASSPATAWKEVLARVEARRGSFLIVEVEIEIDDLNIVDLTNSAIQARCGVTEALLIDANHEPCQRLAARLRAEEVQALWTFSRADYPEGRTLVVFLDLLTSDSIRVIQVMDR